MAKNEIQLTRLRRLKGASAWHEPAGFLERYGTEAQCREALMRMRWPGGFRCPHCGHAGHGQLRGRPVLQCNRCKHQASLSAGTLFARSHLPLRTWFLAIDLLTQHAQRKSPRDRFNRRFKLQDLGPAPHPCRRPQAAAACQLLTADGLAG